MPLLKYAKFNSSLQERVEVAHNSELTSHCYGTAFFLQGILPYDCNFDTSGGKTSFLPRIFGLLDKHNSPVDNSVMLSENSDGFIVHGTYVVNGDLLTGYQRKGCGGVFEEVSGMHDVEAYLRSIGVGNPIHKFLTLPGDRKKMTQIHKWAKDVTVAYSKKEKITLLDNLNPRKDILVKAHRNANEILKNRSPEFDMHHYHSP